MNVLTFGISLIIVALFIFNIAPAISDSINNVDNDNPALDDNAVNLARLLPFGLFLGVIAVLLFLWWRGGL